MNFIDLFAGAGGLSEGFMRIDDSIPVAHIEMNEHACNTLRTRASYYSLRNHDIDLYYNYLRGQITRDVLYANTPALDINSVIQSEINDDSIDDILMQINDNMVELDIDHIDVVVGGPPCQAYSFAGRAARENNLNDPRKLLYLHYMQVIHKYNPYFFVFENVPGIATVNEGEIFENIQELMEGLGYDLDIQLLNSYDYGVLQSRRRYIIVGKREDLGNINFPNFVPVEGANEYTVNDILVDLQNVQAGESSDIYGDIPTEYLLDFNIRNESDVLTWHVARPHNINDRNIYRLIIEAWNNGGNRLLYNELPEQMQTHNNVTSFLDRYKLVAGNLPYSHTMLAHIAKDGHYFIHPDYNQARSLTVREAARIQSFPDNYFFEGPRTSVFTQIGNAVPPLMSGSIALGIHERLIEIQNIQNGF